MISHEGVELGRLVYPDLDLCFWSGGAAVRVGFNERCLDICWG